MVRSSALVALCCFFVLAVPASARVVPPQCEDVTLVTPVDRQLNLPAPKCVGLTNQVSLDRVLEPAHGQIFSGVYVPSARYHGEDQIRYTVTDAVNGRSNEFTVRVIVDTPPTCRDMAVTATIDRALILPAPDCTDADGDEIDVYYDDPINGTLQIQGRSLVYTPKPGFTGSDSFPYFAEDEYYVASEEDALMQISVVPVPKIVIPIPVRTPAPTPTPTRPPLDTTAPVVGLKDASKKQAVAVTLTRNENVTAKLTLTLDKATAKKLKLSSRTVGTLQSALAPGTSKLPIKLTAKAAKALKKAKKVTVTLTAVVTDTAGNSTTKSLVLTLKK